MMKPANRAALALPGEWINALNGAEQQYLNSLPAIPLLAVPEVIVVKGTACSAVSSLWNFGEDNPGCP